MQGIVKNEQQLIRLLIDNSKLLDKVDPVYFVTDIGRNLYYTLEELNEKNIEPSKIHIISFGNSRDSSIIPERVDSLLKIKYSSNSFEHYYKRLKTDYAKYIIRKKHLSSMIEYISEKGEFDTEKIRNLTNEIEKNLDIIEDKKEIMINPNEMVDRYINVLNLRNRGEHFFSTGDPYLDSKLTVGLAPKWITTIFGATGIGKSTFTLNLINKQINRHIPCLYVSLEMDLISTMDRLIALRNKIPIIKLYPNVFKNESIPSYILRKIEYERNNLGKAKYFYFIEEPGLSIKDLIYYIKKAKKEMNVDYLICVIDLLTMIREFNEGKGSKAEIYENCMNWLHAIAKELNVHFIGVVQANRETDNYVLKNFDDIKKLKPTLNNIKNSQAIAARSRIVISTFRGKYYAERYLPDLPETKIMSDIMEVDILKQNMGGTPHMKYLYDSDIARIYKYEDSAIN